jgi:hypothetical protein
MLALYKLLVDKSPTLAKAAAAALSCMELVISAMEHHPHDATTQRTACNSLACFSKTHDDCRNMVLDADCLVPVVWALRIHKDDAQVKLKAHMAIDTISPKNVGLLA